MAYGKQHEVKGRMKFFVCMDQLFTNFLPLIPFHTIPHQGCVANVGFFLENFKSTLGMGSHFVNAKSSSFQKLSIQMTCILDAVVKYEIKKYEGGCCVG